MCYVVKITYRCGHLVKTEFIACEPINRGYPCRMVEQNHSIDTNCPYDWCVWHAAPPLPPHYPYAPINNGTNVIPPSAADYSQGMASPQHARRSPRGNVASPSGSTAAKSGIRGSAKRQAATTTGRASPRRELRSGRTTKLGKRTREEDTDDEDEIQQNTVREGESRNDL